MSEIIKYGISSEYIPDWGFTEAYREIIQNFMDYGQYEINEDNDYVCISNDYEPDNLEFLKVGCSDKRGSNNRGKHGEGLKMAMLVLHRLGIDCVIKIKNKNMILFPKNYNDEYLGECFGFEIFNFDEVNGWEYNFNNFQIIFESNEFYNGISNDFIIKDEDIIFKSDSGSIVNKPVGNIYVGGLFVTNMNRLSYAYDLKPRCVSLGRDRSIPCSFDIEYHCSLINQDYLNNKEDLDVESINFNNRDFDYMSTLPEKVIENITVQSEDEEGIKFSFKLKDTYIPQKFNENIKSYPIIKKQIDKVRMEFEIKLETPYDILSNFKKKYGEKMSTEVYSEFKKILTMALKWKKEENS